MSSYPSLSQGSHFVYVKVLKSYSSFFLFINSATSGKDLSVWRLSSSFLLQMVVPFFCEYWFPGVPAA